MKPEYSVANAYSYFIGMHPVELDRQFPLLPGRYPTDTRNHRPRRINQ